MGNEPKHLYDNIWVIEVPLTGSPLKTLNSYVISHSGQSLIIDTGWNHNEAHKTMTNSLRLLQIDPGQSDFFITHMHADHLGLVGEIAGQHSKIFLSRKDSAWLEVPNRFNLFADFAISNGFPRLLLKKALSDHPAVKYGPKGRPLPFTKLDDGDYINVGGLKLVCIGTPGHTIGHMCLFSPDRRLMFGGDHILGSITPSVQLWTPNGNPLRDYLNSLSKVVSLGIDVVLPGHGKPIHKVKDRVEDLANHHEARLNEINRLLGFGSLSAYELAARMKWDIHYRDWDDFPLWQKWFAMGEALSHLRYLEDLKAVRSMSQNSKIKYEVN